MRDSENVIKRLTEISEYARVKADIAGIGKGKEVFDSWYRAAEDAIDLLREQEAVAGARVVSAPAIGGWISVKDRLPETAKVCLVYGNGRMVVARHIANNEWITAVFMPNITHWMPLPEPPQE